MRFGFFWRSLQQEEMRKGSAVMILLLPTNLAWYATDVRAEGEHGRKASAERHKERWKKKKSEK